MPGMTVPVEAGSVALSVKGTAAGCINLLLAFLLGDRLPDMFSLSAAMFVGFLAYGVSLALFVVGLRHLGTARTGAFFSVAPFFGAIIALGSGESVTLRIAMAGILMAIGIWLHLTERHEHRHAHESIEHDHEHLHDEHHQHNHETLVAAGVSPTHRHRHEPLVHSHTHFPDAHHRGHDH